MKKQLLLKQVKQNNVFHVGYLKSRPANAGLLFGFLTLLLFPAGCVPTSQLTANLGQQFSLSINQTAVISGENLRIKFLDVNDSRCPTGATCIWAGEARAEIQVRDGGAANLTLVEHGYSANNSQRYKAYEFSFQVQPYPALANPIAKAEYRLILTVEKPGEAPVE
ncbi:MAG: hypothetical protein Q7R50_00480 [Dehalococcoidales bacterium]|nr:hypothetical protein [Dehalococcoidales bacterium]